MIFRLFFQKNARILLVFSGLLVMSNAQADIRLPAIFGSHMVLQQNDTINFWGWAAPRHDILVLCSWLPGREFPARADRATLRWSVVLPTPPASLTPHTITIKGGWTDLVLDDVLFGEVWLCSGQSNMEWQPAWGNVDVSPAQYAAANDPGLRFFTVPRTSMPNPQDDCRAEWQVSRRATMTQFSAAAYFFGRELRDRLGVPVGLINASWGGTPVEAWKHEAAFTAEDWQLLLYDEHPVWQYGRPGSLWNGMIAPLTSLKIKGFLWYQGETNTYNPGDYARLLEQMVADWRRDFGNPTLPFYYVQIAPWRYDIPRQGAALRDAQRRALDRVQPAGMVVISDIGDPDDIHPRNKADVGRRLAAWALANTYGWTNVAFSGPLYRDFVVENDRVRVRFDFAENGLTAKNGPPCCFEIAGADRRFFPAKAEIDGATVLLSAPEAPQPVAVRFAFDNLAEPNLFNAAGLPASCFRTDDWPAVWPDARFKVEKMLPSGDALLKIIVADPRCRVRYTLDGAEPSETAGEWANPDQALQITRGQTLKTRVFDAAGAPADRTGVFALLAHLASGRAAVSNPAPSTKYAGSAGDFTLTDGLPGTADIHDPAWLGYLGENPVWTIDLGQSQHVTAINAGFLVATANWVFPPQALTVFVSDDGKKFTEAGRTANTLPTRHVPARRQALRVEVGQKARFVRVSAKSVGACPGWHQGKGEKAWLFVDEIAVE